VTEPPSVTLLLPLVGSDEPLATVVVVLIEEATANVLGTKNATVKLPDPLTAKVPVTGQRTLPLVAPVVVHAAVDDASS